MIGEQVYDVPKKCYQCGAEWEGKSFAPQPADKPRLPGICAACIDRDELALRAAVSRAAETTPKDTVLEPPRPVHDVDEDQGYPRPRLVGDGS